MEIRGARLVLRPLRPDEIDGEWQAMVESDPIAIASPPDEVSFRARLGRSGRLEGGSLDLAVDLDGACIGRIQTFVPRGSMLPPGVFQVGIGLRDAVRGRGHGREALALLTGWLFEHAGALRVQAPTDPANAAMRAVFDHVGWREDGTLAEHGRVWLVYAITREEWSGRPGKRVAGIEPA